MAAKCPACGFESAEGAQWCEFCKEPFNKKKAAPPPSPASQAKAATVPPPAPAGFDDLPPAVREKLLELRPGQDGESVPEAPKWLKPVAVGFVALVALLSVVFALIFVVKTRTAR